MPLRYIDITLHISLRIYCIFIIEQFLINYKMFKVVLDYFLENKLCIQFYPQIVFSLTKWYISDIELCVNFLKKIINTKLKFSIAKSIIVSL